MASPVMEAGFRSELIGKELYQIWEQSGVSCFLLVGADRALLLDTGYGLWDLRGFVEKLTDKPIMVVNSHGHIDHVGGNWQFREAYLHPADFGLTRRHTSESERRKAMEFLAVPSPDHLSHGMCPLRAIAPRQRFDLGKRMVEAVPCPGHTAGSIALFDEETGIALVGDALSRHVWLFDEDSTRVADMSESIRRLQAYDMRAAYCSHSPERLEPGFFGQLADFAARVRIEKSAPFAVPLAGTTALIYHEGGALFESADFLSIVYTPEKLR